MDFLPSKDAMPISPAKPNRKRPKTPLERAAEKVHEDNSSVMASLTSPTESRANLKVNPPWKLKHRNRSATKTTLSKEVVKKIDAMIREIQKGQKEFDVDILDYRFWECIRCRWNPRKVVRVVFKSRRIAVMRFFDWWKLQHIDDRADLVELSRLSGKPPADLTNKRLSLWSRIRERSKSFGEQ